jgi:tRNA U34 5-methylaminomethyl-2-thiouridine-forming methyltransferase MnmC
MSSCMRVKPELIITEDGSHTLYIREIDEHYHSVHGALTESRHVFIDAGLRSVEGTRLEIFEMGFGTGLNAFLTLAEIRGSGRTVHYTGLEKYPLGHEIVASLNYGSLFPSSGAKFFEMLHKCPWNRETAITEDFTINKIQGDVCSLDIRDRFDLVYFDAFAPDKQPELWTREIFSQIYLSMRQGAILTTYSSKGQVRRNMADAGFRVEKLPGPPGKREMIRARKE